MARVYLPAHAVRAAGGLDDVVFSYMDATWNGGIQTARAKAMQVYNPNTAAQQIVRANFAAAVNFFKNALSKTIGVTVFTRVDFDTIYADLQELKQYKGVPVTGRQLFIGGVVVAAEPIPAIPLPQDCVVEADLVTIIEWLDAAQDNAAARTQTWRLGFQE